MLSLNRGTRDNIGSAATVAAFGGEAVRVVADLDHRHDTLSERDVLEMGLEEGFVDGIAVLRHDAVLREERREGASKIRSLAIGTKASRIHKSVKWSLTYLPRVANLW